MQNTIERTRKNDIRLRNVLFPFWFLLLLPQLWLIVLPGNFLIDSLVMLLCMIALKTENRKLFYKKHIIKVFLFGLLADIIGSAFMLLMVVAEIGGMGDELYLTIPALIISSVMIFIFDYFVTFRKDDKNTRLKMSLVYAIATAPYTFLVPSSWLYGGM